MAMVRWSVRALSNRKARGGWGVTDAAEGLALRGAGVNARILLMTGIWKGEEDGIVRAEPYAYRLGTLAH